MCNAADPSDNRTLVAIAESPAIRPFLLGVAASRFIKAAAGPSQQMATGYQSGYGTSYQSGMAGDYRSTTDGWEAKGPGGRNGYADAAGARPAESGLSRGAS